MAEQEPALAEGAEGVTAPEDEQQPEEQALTVESLAAEMGWVPKDQFRGAEEEWKPADQFIRDGREIQKSLSSELRKVRDEVGRLGRTSADLTERIVKEKVAEAEAHWKSVHARAVEDGKQDVADRAVSELVKLKSEAPASPGAQIPPETAEFQERHKKWFGVDALATTRAKQIAQALAEDGHDIPTQLREAERLIRKEFPEHFPKAKDPPGTQTGASRAANSGSRAKGFADMPPESQAMARDYQKRHGLPVEKFAESYWADEAKKQRRA